jgi:hypothetical protein
MRTKIAGRDDKAFVPQVSLPHALDDELGRILVKFCEHMRLSVETHQSPDLSREVTVPFREERLAGRAGC